MEAIDVVLFILGIYEIAGIAILSLPQSYDYLYFWILSTLIPIPSEMIISVIFVSLSRKYHRVEKWLRYIMISLTIINFGYFTLAISSGLIILVHRYIDAKYGNIFILFMVSLGFHIILFPIYTYSSGINRIVYNVIRKICRRLCDN